MFRGRIGVLDLAKGSMVLLMGGGQFGDFRDLLGANWSKGIFHQNVTDGARALGPGGSAVGSQPLALLYLCSIVPLFIHVSIGPNLMFDLADPLSWTEGGLLTRPYDTTVSTSVVCGSYPPLGHGGLGALECHGKLPSPSQGRAMGGVWVI
ncbi:hypothetical protein VNO77_38835 [Canavalia gladiata]|uniref:Uncharacterized protein n=1 Tax=Canavalia gladiata TaxID=3824 RepID=A0AAN9K9B7_CANGL